MSAALELETGLGRVEVRELDGLEELRAAEELQLAVWGRDTIPEGRELLLAMQHAGGLVGGAFDPRGTLAGLVFAFPTRDPALQHSHRLAVLSAWRGQGLGAALKWFQRAWCLERGINRVEWTVDPLRMPNAELNAGRLGAGSSTYWLDYYGAMQGIDAGIPSDRLLMTWRLDSPRVCALAGEDPTPGPSPKRGGEEEFIGVGAGALTCPNPKPQKEGQGLALSLQKEGEGPNSSFRIEGGDPTNEEKTFGRRVGRRPHPTPIPPPVEAVNLVRAGRPEEARLDVEANTIRLLLPEDFVGLTVREPGLALEWRLHARLLFQTYFARGYAICGFTRQGGPAYLLERSQA